MADVLILSFQSFLLLVIKKWYQFQLRTLILSNIWTTKAKMAVFDPLHKHVYITCPPSDLHKPVSRGHYSRSLLNYLSISLSPAVSGIGLGQLVLVITAHRPYIAFPFLSHLHRPVSLNEKRVYEVCYNSNINTIWDTMREGARRGGPYAYLCFMIFKKNV